MRDVICEETARLCLQVYRDRLRAVVLTGSLARNEGTFVKDDLGCLLLGDAEFLLVFGDRAALPTDADRRVIRQEVEERVKRRGLRAEITLTAGRLNYLRHLPPSIFAYELRHRGETVAGDRETLSLIPDFSPADIPLEDAWRLLANRLVEQLEGAHELLEGRPILSPALHYRTVKLYLDMATSLLVFVGGYRPTYRERARNLAVLLDSPSGTSSWPFRLKPFVDDVVACTEWKLGATDLASDVERTFWERAIDHAQVLWQWELARLVDADSGTSAGALMARWMRQQPLGSRARGWAHVVRQHGLRQSWSRLPAWARVALRISPRHSVYATATELLFELRSSALEAARGAGDHPRRREVMRRLPVAPRSTARNGNRAWTDLAADVLLNYRQFLVNTRS